MDGFFNRVRAQRVDLQDPIGVADVRSCQDADSVFLFPTRIAPGQARGETASRLRQPRRNTEVPPDHYCAHVAAGQGCNAPAVKLPTAARLYPSRRRHAGFRL